jgi:hypothetical protein
LRPGIAKGRSCVSVLVVLRRKLSLVEPFHGGGGQPWPSSSSMTGVGARRGGEELERRKGAMGVRRKRRKGKREKRKEERKGK